MMGWQWHQLLIISRQITMPVPYHSIFTGQILFLSPSHERYTCMEGALVPICQHGVATHDDCRPNFDFGTLASSDNFFNMLYCTILQCFDAVRWVAGTAVKTEW